MIHNSVVKGFRAQLICVNMLTSYCDNNTNIDRSHYAIVGPLAQSRNDCWEWSAAWHIRRRKETSYHWHRNHQGAIHHVAGRTYNRTGRWCRVWCMSPITLSSHMMCFVLCGMWCVCCVVCGVIFVYRCGIWLLCVVCVLCCVCVGCGIWLLSESVVCVICCVICCVYIGCGIW